MNSKQRQRSTRALERRRRDAVDWEGTARGFRAEAQNWPKDLFKFRVTREEWQKSKESQAADADKAAQVARAECAILERKLGYGP